MLTGGWRDCGVTLQSLGNKINKGMKEQLNKSAELVKETLVGHIDDQDLGWTPLSPITVRIKHSSKIYIDTGELKSSLVVRGITSKVNGSTIFIGANPWTTHKDSGMKISDLMLILEYGNAYIPPRPLIRPTWEEVKPKIESDIKSCVGDIRRT